MSQQPEIAPEIRGLLEEVVADPRSSIRFAPRRALREWFDRGETVSARDAVGTSAERHLVAAHREALASMLLEASRIAFWKAPVLAHRPRSKNGTPFDERQAESAWIPLAERRARRSLPGAEGVSLLSQCLAGIPAARGHALAQASLALVPSNRARLFVALTIPWDRPRTAIALLDRLSSNVRCGSELADVLSCLGARLSAVGRLDSARSAYRAARSSVDGFSLDTFYVFSLSCCLGDVTTARLEAGRLEPLSEEDARVLEAIKVLREWRRYGGIGPRDSDRLVARIVGRLPPVASALCEALSS